MLSFTCFVHNVITQRFEVDMRFVFITYMYIVLIRLFHHKVLYFVFLTHTCEHFVSGLHFTLGKGMA